MSYTPRRDDLEEPAMPDEWREVADRVLPGNREQLAESGASEWYTHPFALLRMVFDRGAVTGDRTGVYTHVITTANDQARSIYEHARRALAAGDLRPDAANDAANDPQPDGDRA